MDAAAIVASIDPIKMLEIISLSEAEKISGLSHDTIKRRHGDKIIKLSPRRNGMRLIDALFLGEVKKG